MRFLKVIFILLAVTYCVEPCFAEDSRNFSSLKKESLRLRNIDPAVTKESEWRKLLHDLVEYSKIAPDSDAAVALYDAAMLAKDLFKAKHDQEDLDQVSSLLKKVYTEYPTANFADDSIKELSDLEELEGNTSRSRELLELLIKEYPESELSEVAKLKLSGSKSKSRTEDVVIERDGIGPTIVLDPGHGGEDFGAVGIGGLYEKDVTLAVSLEVKQRLMSSFNTKVELTRTSDTFVPLEKRTQFANDKRADIFVSLHTNASEKGNLEGFEVYYLDNTNDSATLKLAEKENATRRQGDSVDDVSFILSDLIQSSKMPESSSLASVFAKVVPSLMNEKWPGLKSFGSKKAPFYVLVGAHMPAVLIEMYFINHPKEGALLAEKRFRGDLAGAVAEAIGKFIKR